MAQFHFVEDYERYVRALMRSHPIDEAMSLAVGGDYARTGRLECEILRHLGLKDGDSLVDFGCGSGRLAAHLAEVAQVGYLGLDVAAPLLAYARTKSPPHYRFVRNTSLTLPVEAASVDWFSSFSVFTHLLHPETYIYLEEMHRCLRPRGRVVASFLEFADPYHWAVFEQTVALQRASQVPHLNQFVERGTWTLWAAKIGFSDVAFIGGQASPWPSGETLGQSIAVLTKG